MEALDVTKADKRLWGEGGGDGGLMVQMCVNHDCSMG